MLQKNYQGLRHALAALGLIATAAVSVGCGPQKSPESGLDSVAVQQANWAAELERASAYEASIRGAVASLSVRSGGDDRVNWFNLDPEQDKLEGASTERGYKELGLGAGETVVVAVIDSGIDINHEDLKGRMWVNEAERDGKPDVDDDGNGYVDDVNGWNFIGGRDGRHVDFDTLEVTRQVKRLRDLKAQAEAEGLEWTVENEAALAEVSKAYDAQYKEMSEAHKVWSGHKKTYTEAKKIVTEAFDLEEVTLEAVAGLESDDEVVAEAIKNLQFYLLRGIGEARFEATLGFLDASLNYQLNLDYDSRKDIVGDDPNDFSDRFYGNKDVIGPDPSHGTHCAGIIAATRDNDLGMAGVASNVKIMTIRAVPNGDERDKDVASAVRYAVDNGAKVINMSFGKAFSPQKSEVDAAFQYAVDHGVLLVHAAGNDANDNDVRPFFPNRAKRDGSADLATWVEVGASARKRDESLPASFSNYGKKSVDLFAPGHDIYSTVPGNGYDFKSGTSMAGPVVSGVAALVWSQYPSLTAAELKSVLLASVRSYNDFEVLLPSESGEEKTVLFSDLSASGGVVDAYAALSLAKERVTDNAK